jgi:hypothetical protein
MDSSPHYRSNPGEHYQPTYNTAPKMNKNPYSEHVEPAVGQENHPPSAGSFGRTPTAHDDTQLTDSEIALLRKLRTLQGGDYEALYFDSKPNPNKKSFYEKMGNPTPL